MKVRFTRRAHRRARLVAKWWRENRPDAADLFEIALSEAKQKLAGQPHAGTRYKAVLGAVVFRLLLPKTEQHVYFSVDESAQAVVVHTIWGARRGRGPRL